MSDPMRAEVELQPNGLMPGNFRMEIHRGPDRLEVMRKLSGSWLQPSLGQSSEQSLLLVAAGRPYVTIGTVEEFMRAALEDLGFTPMFVGSQG